MDTVLRLDEGSWGHCSACPGLGRVGSVLPGGRNAPTPLWLTQTLPPSPVQVLHGVGMLAAARMSHYFGLLTAFQGQCQSFWGVRGCKDR